MRGRCKMGLTQREIFVYGWCFGTIVRASGDRNIGGDFTLAAQRPCTASVKIITEANRRGLFKNSELDMQIAEAMAEITHVPDPGPEPLLPLELQGVWQMGYFAGYAGKPMKFDLKAARKAKGMTQKQLAAVMGVNQDQISRWENGQVTPNKSTFEKLKEILT